MFKKALLCLSLLPLSVLAKWAHNDYNMYALENKSTDRSYVFTLEDQSSPITVSPGQIQGYMLDSSPVDRDFTVTLPDSKTAVCHHEYDARNTGWDGRCFYNVLTWVVLEDGSSTVCRSEVEPELCPGAGVYQRRVRK
jgi:hypothetical protein